MGFGLILGFVGTGFGREEGRAGVELEEETEFEEVALPGCAARDALSTSEFRSSFDPDSFPLSGEAAAFLRCLSASLPVCLITMETSLLVAPLHFEACSRSLLGDEAGHDEDDLDEEEGKSHRCLRH